jgi:arylamine N-acetyltransferase
LRAITPRGRVSVMNETVTRRHDGREEKWPLGSRLELRALLNEYFGFDLPESERLRVPSIPGWL